MNKTQFCALLGNKLKPYLSPKEMYKTLNFFEEMIDDRIDEGLSEEEAVSQLGDINIIVDQILDEHNTVIIKPSSVGIFRGINLHTSFVCFFPILCSSKI